MAFIVGLLMGLIGAGGSILSSGLMIYIFGFNPALSASYTLLNVGIISLIGTVQYYRKNLVDFTAGLLFSLPAIVTVLCMRSLIMPAIPDVPFEYNGLVVTKELCMMLVFAILMILIAWNMIHNGDNRNKRGTGAVHKPVVFLTAPIVGVLTGIVGVGGGFLIVPALLFFNGLDIKTAVGTSLFIIFEYERRIRKRFFFRGNLQLDVSVKIYCRDCHWHVDQWNTGGENKRRQAEKVFCSGNPGSRLLDTS